MTASDQSGGDYLARLVAKFVVWVDKRTVDVPDGCTNCGLSLVTKPEYDECPFCGWGPNAEPEKTGEEARREFLNEVINNHVKR